MENNSSSARKPPPATSKTTAPATVVTDEDVMDNLAQPLNTFFQRSNSMSFVAATDSDPFEVCIQAVDFILEVLPSKSVVFTPFLSRLSDFFL